MISLIKRRVVDVVRGADRIVETLENLSVLIALTLVVVYMLMVLGSYDPLDLGGLPDGAFLLGE